MLWLEDIINFCENNTILLAIIAVLTVVTTILEKSSRIKTPIQSFIHFIKKTKSLKKEKENRKIQEEENIKFLVDSFNSTKESIASIKVDIEVLKDNQDKQQQSIISNELDRIRWEILDFANSMRNGRKHTRNEFEHIRALSKKYERLLAETKQENGVFEAEYQYIIEIYSRHLHDNDFLS